MEDNTEAVSEHNSTITTRKDAWIGSSVVVGNQDKHTHQFSGGWDMQHEMSMFTAAPTVSGGGYTLTLKKA